MQNVIIAQSGGPTAVINASLLGVVEGCRSYPGRFGRIYAAHHGVEGILREELIDLTSQDQREMQYLRTTPAAGAIGTCRYKIKGQQTEDFERIVDVFRTHSVGAFFYIGGNDSMDTAHRISGLARDRGLDVVCVGVPKTIDNDLGDPERILIDHTPGYGSVARYWANMILGLNEENRGSCPADPVMVVQAMGRRIGFIPAAARLADPLREMPLLIVLPESRITLSELTRAVRQQVKSSGRAMVIVSEGFDVGNESQSADSFGHTQFGSVKISVMQTLINHLNACGLPARGAARGQIPGTHQRHSIVNASAVDLSEAYEVGRHAASIAQSNGTGYMATIVREPGAEYSVRYDKAPLMAMANSERTFPAEWIADSGTDVSDEFVAYATPLLGTDSPSIPMEKGLPRFARLSLKFVEKRCVAYVPEAHRERTSL